MSADHMANDDHPTPLLASDGAADRCPPAAPTAGIPRTADLGRGNYTGMEWASAELTKKFAALDSWPLPPPASPARLFGSSVGAMALADAVGATEPRRIERLEARMVEVEARVSEQLPAHQATDHGAKGRRTPKRRGGETKVTKSKTEKRVTKAYASKLLRQMEKEVLRDIREEFDHPTESTLKREAAERLYSKSDSELTQMLHERYDFPTTGRKTLSRTNEYMSWAPHRTRGNAGRLDPESPAVDATAAGGESSKSGATRNTDYVASQGLHESKFRKIPTLDTQGRRNINDDQEGKAFLRDNPQLFGEHLDAGQ